MLSFALTVKMSTLASARKSDGRFLPGCGVKRQVNDDLDEWRPLWRLRFDTVGN